MSRLNTNTRTHMQSFPCDRFSRATPGPQKTWLDMRRAPAILVATATVQSAVNTHSADCVWPQSTVCRANFWLCTAISAAHGLQSMHSEKFYLKTEFGAAVSQSYASAKQSDLFDIKEYPWVYFDGRVDYVKEFKNIPKCRVTWEDWRGEDCESRLHHFDRIQPVRGGARSGVGRPWNMKRTYHRTGPHFTGLDPSYFSDFLINVAVHKYEFMRYIRSKSKF